MPDEYPKALVDAAFLLPIFTGLLSLMGSITIVFILLRRMKNGRLQNRLSTTYERLVFGMSVMDVLSSTAVVLSILPAPKDFVFDHRNDRWMGYGSTITCSIQGFFYYVGMNGTALYYCVLCIYYAIVIRKNKVRTGVEVIFHSIPIIYCLSTGIFLAAAKYFNPAYSVCWISHYPLDCTEDPSTCERGRYAGLYRILFAAVPVITSFFIITGCMISLIRTVKQQEWKMQQYDFASKNSSNSNRSGIGNESGNRFRNSVFGSVINNRYRGSIFGSVSYHTGNYRNSVFASIRHAPNKSVNRLSMLIFPNSNKKESSTKIFSSTTTNKMKRTNQQAMLYVLAYFITFIFGISNQVYTIFFRARCWPLILLQQATTPAHGFLNFLVYIRPQVLRVRKKYPDISLYAAFLEAVLARIDERRTMKFRRGIVIRENGVRHIDITQSIIRNVDGKRSRSFKSGGIRRSGNRRDFHPTFIEEKKIDFSDMLSTHEDDGTSGENELDLEKQEHSDYIREKSQTSMMHSLDHYLQERSESSFMHSLDLSESTAKIPENGEYIDGIIHVLEKDYYYYSESDDEQSLDIHHIISRKRTRSVDSIGQKQEHKSDTFIIKKGRDENFRHSF